MISFNSFNVIWQTWHDHSSITMTEILSLD